jgi:hypothetical protein
MAKFYKKNVYHDLGEDIRGGIKENDCKFEVNYDNHTYIFTNCPGADVKKMLITKELRGIGSLLHEFIPSQLCMPSAPGAAGASSKSDSKEL